MAGSARIRGRVWDAPTRGGLTRHRRGTGPGRLLPVALCLLLALLALLALPALPASAGDREAAEDEALGWPLRDSDRARMDRQLRRPQPATPLPQRSEVTEQALAAWPGNEPAAAAAAAAAGAATLDSAAITDLSAASALPTVSGGAAAPAEVASPEIAPLKRIIPPVRHERILYAPGDFSISVGTAERLSQIAMRLRGTRDRISIVAHSRSRSGPGAGDAQISTHEAVKLSFKRAMLVRLYLIEEGVSPDQIDLEALPQADDGGPPDRVEISPTSKAARR